MSEGHLTPAQLAARWSMHVGTLANWRSKGKGPAFTHVGTSVRYPIEGVRQYEAARTTEPVTEDAPE